jgi:hypothetical protein
LLPRAAKQQDPDATLALSRGLTTSITGFAVFVASVFLLAVPLLSLMDAEPEPGWAAVGIFLALTGLATGVGCTLGEIIWLLVASRFVSRERLERFVLSRAEHPWLRTYRRWMLRSVLTKS